MMGSGNEVVIVVKSRDESARGFNSAEKRAGGFKSAIGGMAKGAALGLAGVGVASVVMGGKFVKAAEESQKVSRQTQAVLKSTGGAARVTARDVDSLAKALSKKSGVDDEVIASGENVMLTFTGIRNEIGEGNDIFNQATVAALDMSAALGQDMQSSVIQLGKALNDPIAGVTALRRVGVQLTDQQKEQIKTLMEHGDKLGAQKVILAELTKEFGGSAEANATASDKMSVAWGNMEEALGTALLPLVEQFSDWMINTGVPAIENYLVPAIEDGLVPALQGIADFMTQYVLPPLKEFSDWVTDTAAPAIEDFAAKVKDRSKEAFQSATDDQEGYRGAFDAAWSWVQEKFWSVIDSLRNKWAAFVEWIQPTLETMQQKFWDVLDRVHAKWQEFGPRVREIIDSIRAKWNAAVDKIKEKWNAAGDWLVDKLQYVKIVAGVVFDPFITGVKKAIGWVQSLIDRVQGLITKIQTVVFSPQAAFHDATTGTIDPKHLAKGHAAGGITTAATGGARGGWNILHEQGAELVRLPSGSMVYPHGQSMQMLASAGGAVTIHINLSGGPQQFMEWLRDQIWVEQGGNVQAALGR